MGAPKVTSAEVDLSTRVPAFPGVTAGIVIPAKKGPVDVPTLVTSEEDFLKKFTPDERIEVGYDNAYFSASAYLQKANRLYVVRSANAALFGGSVFKTTGASSANSGFLTGETDPENTYTFDNTSGDTDALIIVGANPGVWNNKIEVKITPYETTVGGGENANTVKEPNAFIIEVLKNGSTEVLESWIASLDAAHLDGFNKNIFVESLLLGSNYIRGYVNPAVVGSTTLPKEQTTVLALASGSDGSTVLSGNMITSANTLSNTNSIALTILLDGGFADAPFQINLVSIAESRQDCVAILSTPVSDENNASYVQSIIDYRRSTGTHTSDGIGSINSSFAALYTPHVKIFDRFNNRDIIVSPDGYVGGIISQTASNFEMWFPPAGFRRGSLLVSDLNVRFSDGEMDSLYDAGINPNRFAVGRGILVWGQKTTLTRPSTLDRLNVRLLLIVIEPSIKTALEDFVFEINDEVTRAQIVSIIQSFMDGIQARRGVFDYSVISDSSNNSAEDIDNHILRVDLFVQPAQSAEFIKLRTLITRTGVDFSSVAQAV